MNGSFEKQDRGGTGPRQYFMLTRKVGWGQVVKRRKRTYSALCNEVVLRAKMTLSRLWLVYVVKMNELELHLSTGINLLNVVIMLNKINQVSKGSTFMILWFTALILKVNNLI